MGYSYEIGIKGFVVSHKHFYEILIPNPHKPSPPNPSSPILQAFP